MSGARSPRRRASAARAARSRARVSRGSSRRVVSGRGSARRTDSRRLPSAVSMRDLGVTVREDITGNSRRAASHMRCISRGKGTVSNTPAAVRLKGVRSRGRLAVDNSKGGCRFGDTEMGKGSYICVKGCGSAMCCDASNIVTVGLSSNRGLAVACRRCCGVGIGRRVPRNKITNAVAAGTKAMGMGATRAVHMGTKRA